jgi:hypothetical protein
MRHLGHCRAFDRGVFRRSSRYGAEYEEQLNEGDRLRKEIADDAELDLTEFAEDPYEGTFIVVEEPDEDDVDFLTSIRVLERWDRVQVPGHT